MDRLNNQTVNFSKFSLNPRSIQEKQRDAARVAKRIYKEARKQVEKEFDNSVLLFLYEQLIKTVPGHKLSFSQIILYLKRLEWDTDQKVSPRSQPELI